MHRRTLPAVAVVLVALAPACSGAASSDLLTGSGGVGSSGGTGGRDAGIDSGRPVEDAGTRDGTTFDAGNPPEAGAPEAGGNDGGGPQGPQVLCPQNGQPSKCNPGEICCVSADSQGGTQTDTCDPSGATCAGTPVHCASPADCPSNEVCCGTESYDPNTGSYMYTDVSCAKDCTGQGHYAFCDPQHPNDCPSGTGCGPSQLLQGFSVCQ